MDLIHYYSLTIILLVLTGLEAGRWFGNRWRRKGGDEEGLGSLKASVYGLMGLIVAFTFNDAMGRWEYRRELAAQEYNDAGTAWLRLRVAPPEDRPALRQAMRDYLDARLAFYDEVLDTTAQQRVHKATEAAQQALWNLAVEAAAHDPSTRTGMLLLPSLNAMFDTGSLRMLVIHAHPPGFVFAVLYLLITLSAVLTGHEMGRAGNRSVLHSTVFALVMACAVFVIIDLQYPRAGLIRIDDVNAGMRAMRGSWDQE